MADPKELVGIGLLILCCTLAAVMCESADAIRLRLTPEPFRTAAPCPEAP